MFYISPQSAETVSKKQRNISFVVSSFYFHFLVLSIVLTRGRTPHQGFLIKICRPEVTWYSSIQKEIMLLLSSCRFFNSQDCFYKLSNIAYRKLGFRFRNWWVEFFEDLKSDVQIIVTQHSHVDMVLEIHSYAIPRHFSLILQDPLEGGFKSTNAEYYQ